MSEQNSQNHSKKVVGIIPARGNSKAIPKKNIKDFAGKPLLYWVLQAASQASVLDVTFVATDCDTIANTVLDFNLPNVAIYKRTPESATDTAPSEMVLLEVATKENFDDLIFLQATNPFLFTEDIEKAYERYQTNHFDSLLSVVPQRRFLWQENKNGAKSMSYDIEKRPRRQETKPFFVENGGLYITSRKRLLETRNRLSGKVGLYEMSPYSYIELDEPSDWEQAEILFQQKGFHKPKTLEKI